MTPALPFFALVIVVFALAPRSPSYVSASGASMVAIDETKYDGKATVKDYDPQHPEEPWSALSDRYLRLHDRAGGHFFRRFIGQFYDDKEAKAFLTKVLREAKFARHLNPRFPPMVSDPGALLVSDRYTCTLNHSNPELRYADWIAEVDGTSTPHRASRAARAESR